MPRIAPDRRLLAALAGFIGLAGRTATGPARPTPTRPARAGAASRALVLLAGIAATAWLVAPAPAAAVGLGTLLGGGGAITSTDGALWLGDFTLSTRSDHEGTNVLADIDPASIDLQLVESGDVRALAIEAPLFADAFSQGRLELGYTVRAAAGFAIVEAGLSLEAETLGFLASAHVDEALYMDVHARLTAHESEGDARSPFAETSFDAPASDLRVQSRIALDGGMTGSTRVARIEQAFVLARGASPVPEPGAALLFGAGTFVVAMRVRRRR